MSAAESSRGAVGARVRPEVVVGVAAALVALGLGGQGLLVPAGAATTWLRVAGALVSLAGVGALLRIDGPALAARTLAVVTVAGALTGAATLPLSPVSLSDASVTAPAPVPPAGQSEHDPGAATLDRPGPHVVGGHGLLELPEGAGVRLEGDTVVLGLPDGSSVPLGRAAGGGDPSTAGAPAGGPAAPPVAVVVTDGRASRGDGGPIGGDTPLAGVGLRAGGTTVVVGEGALLEVPQPLPPVPVRPPGLTGATDALLAALLVCFALLAFAPPVVRVADRLGVARADPEPPPPPAPAGAAQVEEGLADVLRAMLADPDPRTAVIGAYARLLVALDEVGHGRRDEETPHEHLWRTLGPLGVRPAPVHRLAELFVRARFTPRPLTAAHRAAAVAALADAVADLRLSARDVDEVAESLAVRA